MNTTIPTPPPAAAGHTLSNETPAHPIASGLQLAALRLLLIRLDDCRSACPGIGGDIDASNVRWMLQVKEWHQSGVDQAAKCLERLAGGINAVKQQANCGPVIVSRDALEAIAAVNTFAAARERIAKLEAVAKYALGYAQSDIENDRESAQAIILRDMASKALASGGAA